MSKCPLPDYSTYIRYAAYVKLCDAMVTDINSRGVARPSATTLVDIVQKHKAELVTKYSVVDISLNDNIETMLSKKYANQLHDVFKAHIYEATIAFTEALETLDRPTLPTVEKTLGNVVKGVADDVLNIT